MKVSEILYEVKIGQQLGDPKGSDAYWVFFKTDSIHTFPKYPGNNMKWDLIRHFAKRHVADDEYDRESYKKAEEFLSLSYGKPNSFGWCSVDNKKDEVDFDMTLASRSDNRRLATKISSFNHDAKDAYPILTGESGIQRVVDIVKVLKALVKYDSRTMEYEVVGDDRFKDGTTVSDVLSKSAEIKQHLHSSVFDAKADKLALYHGTSSKNAKLILDQGFKQGKREDAYSDLVPNYSDKNIYFSFDPSVASNYATREAINDGTDAAILKVTLNGLQMSKLRPDEDSMNWLVDTVTADHYKALIKNNPILGEIWGTKHGDISTHFKRLDHKEKSFNLRYLIDQYEKGNEFRQKAEDAFAKYGIKTDEDLKNLEHHIYNEMMKTYINGSFTKGIKQSGTIAYPGSIPASQVELVKTWKIRGTKIKRDNYSAKEYADAIEKQKQTVSKKLKK